MTKATLPKKTGALSEACAIHVLPLQKGEVEEIFFNWLFHESSVNFHDSN
ncbi:MAG: hypothetical protein H6Q48_2551 [Deltaproteobacteria bacterium]|jgi:hypothetical protein|nr:hypothetical protein [Deltaproteobacteria bacterium]